MHTLLRQTFRKHGYLVLSLLLSLVGALAFSTDSTEGMNNRESPKIKFSHKFHVKDSGLSCTDCHASAPTSKMASDNLAAQHENCQTCHADQVEKTCTFCHTSDNVDTYVFPMPEREVRFSHESHVTGQKVECQTCHKDVEASEKLEDVRIPAMTTCTTCHNETKASNACETCHTNFASLRPREHDRTNFVSEHKRLARISDASCMNCHTQETCIDCHNGVGLTQTTRTGKDPVSPRSPRVEAIDRGQGMVLSKVHDLNFRFTHGMAATQKKQECQTCHREQVFCTTCHQAGGNVNQNAFKPATHSSPNWKTIGPGSGGGGHAQLARRDIESCASCHDVQGGDPTCLTCHMDSDGIKGTDPKTHTRSFMSDVNGQWHSDASYSCYLCHTDINARPNGTRGQKFCGYCHN